MDSKKIKDTLLLPKTSFPLRNLNHQEKEKEIRKMWERERIYQKVLEKNRTGKPFILHSGPPYANGKIHLGHVLNFLIKDIIVRSQAVEGCYTPFLLGWDTHGLPIEHKMIQAHQGFGKSSGVTLQEQKVNLRQVCHNFALEQVQLQKEQLKKLGLFTNYEEYYITLDKNYEAEQIRIFGEMVKKGLIYQGFRPIHWSCSHETALAGAEIEYYEKKDTSLYFKIKLAGSFLGKENVNLLVWTTQPWTIPANQLVAVKKTAAYVLVECEGEYLLMLEKRFGLLKEWEKFPKIERKFLGKELVGKYYLHPYRKDNKGHVVSGDEFIQEEEGTGIVHLAPAFGMEDFAAAKKEKLIIDCPLEPNGVFNEKIGVSELVNKYYSEVNDHVITDLEKRNLVIKKAVISHSYPHDWRDKSPLIYRLTKQWFIKVEAIKEELLKNIKKVEWYPNWTQEKMWQAINSREDWCISRQRKWGVPIPVLYKNNEAILNAEIIDYVTDIFVEKGSDCWFDGSILLLLKEKFPNLVDKDTDLGQDIMDVWLDSGVSHWCVLRKINSK
ncbi:MAG: class I tRNA ligase family protein [Candidatus Moeniiplasma glomeromycotorum]|nr:class I tRNA ligase family protein [Candidatus Moeniiplasma glomeromycotorum]MCE8162290.1 class I tRNA ligase family protein [Candidatus Moeniiplasma glomeromycotorum]MCE8166215.1 class I tRNA ligase family protein [Candidatus Moeniiplasma glomeromycotorum]MCE8166696.1 class I tRNA ligase family protein [Candidatus Moeniiplasma glomeromycotorum]